jgi:hypothetical protein
MRRCASRAKIKLVPTKDVAGPATKVTSRTILLRVRTPISKLLMVGITPELSVNLKRSVNLVCEDNVDPIGCASRTSVLRE